MSTIAIPGQVIASTTTHSAGPGTHVFESNICASIIGSVVTLPSSSKSIKPTVSIPRNSSGGQASQLPTSDALPSVRSTVLCRITRVHQRQATASILVVDSTPTSVVPEPTPSSSGDDLQFQALLRREDVRLTEKDRIVMNDMFRVGDIVRATVISLGDEKTYYISTAGNEFGVVIASSEDGNAMVPASWKEMRDVVTGKGELRKVAKPV